MHHSAESGKMLIGIMSDSHGKQQAVRQALEIFHKLGVEHVIHCGDVGGTEVFDELVGWPLTFVWGNTDFPAAPLLTYLKTVGIAPPGAIPAEVTLGGKRFAIFHGHEQGFAQTLENPGTDYICHGHTHERRDERIGVTRIINPGALHRARPKTVATLDSGFDRLEFHNVD